MKPETLTMMRKNAPKKRVALATEGPIKKVRATEVSQQGAPVERILPTEGTIVGAIPDH